MRDTLFSWRNERGKEIFADDDIFFTIEKKIIKHAVVVHIVVVLRLKVMKDIV
jgi:hypothetical protein